MISIENLYWVLYENLLKPLKIDARYFYPFGTTNNLSTDEFMTDESWLPSWDSHVLFHFDQEPIYPSDDLTIMDATNVNWHRRIRILANSEISQLKKDICRRYQLLDWYFFYHGFAALDWYRDARYINSDHEISNAYLSYNHNVMGNRSYRMALTARLAERDLLGLGSVSFHADYKNCIDELSARYNDFSDRDKELVIKHLVDARIQPMKVDHEHIDASFSARFGFHEYRSRQRSLIHLVNETIFYDQKHHLTEKIFQPIVCLRPFILVSSAGALAYLKSYGFQTFDRWIDESYDDIQDNSQRLDAIVDQVDRLANLSLNELKHMHHDMKETLAFNKNHFFNGFKDIIVNELVDNFDRCIRIHNNGRVRKIRPRIQDLDRVKRLLSGFGT